MPVLPLPPPWLHGPSAWQELGPRSDNDYVPTPCLPPPRQLLSLTRHRLQHPPGISNMPMHSRTPACCLPPPPPPLPTRTAFPPHTPPPPSQAYSFQLLKVDSLSTVLVDGVPLHQAAEESILRNEMRAA